MKLRGKLLFTIMIMLISALFVSDVVYGGCGFCRKHRRPKKQDQIAEAKASHKEMGEHSHMPKINAQGLWAMVSAKTPVVILDARSGKWDDGERIPRAKSLSPQAKPEEVKTMLPDRKALIVTYCSNKKCPASNMLFKKLKSMGYINLIEFPAGIQGWKEAGFPVSK